MWEFSSTQPNHRMWIVHKMAGILLEFTSVYGITSAHYFQQSFMVMLQLLDRRVADGGTSETGHCQPEINSDDGLTTTCTKIYYLLFPI